MHTGSPESAVLQYDMLEDNVVDLYHTGVPVAFRGKGIAKVLAKVCFCSYFDRKTLHSVSEITTFKK